MPFQEIPHTSDWSLHVWAADLPGLFVEAARGMNALMGTQASTAPPIKRRFNLTADDPEALLVAFLSELLFFTEHEKLTFGLFDLAVFDEKGKINLNAALTGTPLLSLNKAIKAVTFHNLHIEHTQTGLELEITFDV